MIDLWNHQKEAISRSELMRCFALFFEMGTGKTRTVIEILNHRFKKCGRPLRTLIFTPPIVIKNFQDEFVKYSDISREEVVCLTGPKIKRLEKFIKFTEEDMELKLNQVRFVKKPMPKIFITNYEALQMAELFEKFKAWSPEILVFDESHKLKSTTAKRSKLADELANPMAGRMPLARPAVYLLSGSPILNSPLDIFQQFKVMDGGESFTHNYWIFRAKYFTDRNSAMPRERYFPKWEPKTIEKDGVDALAEINAIIHKNGMRVEKKDCLDLPEELSVQIKVGMTPSQTKAYREMKNDFITFISAEKTASANLAITKALRLSQITSGFVGVDNTDPDRDFTDPIAKFESTPKEDALRELISEITEQGHKVLVWAVWKHNYGQIRQICEELKLGYVEIHGGISETNKLKNLEKFKTDPDCRVFIGHPGSGGIGINLVHAPFSIFFSRTFSLEHYLQARARNHRGGQSQKVVHYDLICEDTIDELVVSALANKQAISDKMLRDFAFNN